MKHAIVKQGGYEIPLIGIPPSSTVGECECCGRESSIQRLKFSSSGQLLCEKCSTGEEQKWDVPSNTTKHKEE